MSFLGDFFLTTDVREIYFFPRNYFFVHYYFLIHNYFSFKAKEVSSYIDILSSINMTVS